MVVSVNDIQITQRIYIMTLTLFFRDSISFDLLTYFIILWSFCWLHNTRWHYHIHSRKSKIKLQYVPSAFYEHRLKIGQIWTDWPDNCLRICPPNMDMSSAKNHVTMNERNKHVLRTHKFLPHLLKAENLEATMKRGGEENAQVQKQKWSSPRPV